MYYIKLHVNEFCELRISIFRLMKAQKQIRVPARFGYKI